MSEEIPLINWDICPRCRGNFIRIGMDMSKVCLLCYREELDGT